MSFLKNAKDNLKKALFGKGTIPRGLAEMQEYFRLHGPIGFDVKNEDGVLVAVSKNYLEGSIVTSGATPEELERNIKDAIMTAFEVPAAYAKEAGMVSLT